MAGGATFAGPAAVSTEVVAEVANMGVAAGVAGDGMAMILGRIAAGASRTVDAEAHPQETVRPLRHRRQGTTLLEVLPQLRKLTPSVVAQLHSFLVAAHH